jgi:pantetheine-phosphate adenylyltransferase
LLFDELVVAVYDRPLKTLLFTPEQRLEMVGRAFADNAKVRVVGYQGLTVEFCRTIGAKVIVRGLRVFSDFEHEFRMALANHRLAPEIEVVALITSEEHSFLTGTTVREIAALNGDVSSLVPPHVAEAFQRRFRELGDEGPGAFPRTDLRD